MHIYTHTCVKDIEMCDHSLIHAHVKSWGCQIIQNGPRDDMGYDLVGISVSVSAYFF